MIKSLDISGHKQRLKLTEGVILVRNPNYHNVDSDLNNRVNQGSVNVQIANLVSLSPTKTLNRILAVNSLNFAAFMKALG